MREVVLVLDNLRSLHNVGSLFRTGDAAGVTEIICCGITATPDDYKMWKVSLGAEQSVQWRYFDDVLFPLEALKQRGFEIVSAELNETSVDYRETTYRNKVALILGAETTGVSPEVLAMTDQVVHIPMRGEKNSLNVSVAGGILLYALTE